MGWLELKVPPPTMMFIIACFMWLDNHLIGGALVSGAPFILGVFLMATGFGVAFTGLRTLIGNHTTPSPMKIDRAKKLVTSGLYQFSRNPMYLGMVIFLIGWTVLLGNLWHLAGPIGFAIYIQRFQIAAEERMMTTKFGADYAAYKNRVRRWI